MTGDEVKKETMCGAQYSDIDVAHKVRMLMRGQLDHEAVCTMGRDRIMYLSQRVSRLEEALRAVTNELESWNITEGDPEAVEAIKAGKAALAH